MYVYIRNYTIVGSMKRERDVITLEKAMYSTL